MSHSTAILNLATVAYMPNGWFKTDHGSVGHSDIGMKMADLIDRQVDGSDRIKTDAGVRTDWVSRVPWMVDHLRRRRWPLAVMLTFVIVSMAYSLWWNPVVHHSQVG